MQYFGFASLAIDRVGRRASVVVSGGGGPMRRRRGGWAWRLTRCGRGGAGSPSAAGMAWAVAPRAGPGAFASRRAGSGDRVRHAARRAARCGGVLVDAGAGGASRWEKTSWRGCCAERGLRPWRNDVFKLSTAPEFEAKLRDVIGLYLNPPERAAVFSFDEKTQIQALDRTRPSLPMVKGRNRTVYPRLQAQRCHRLVRCAQRSPPGRSCTRPANAIPAKTWWRSSNGSACTRRAISKCT